LQIKKITNHQSPITNHQFVFLRLTPAFSKTIIIGDWRMVIFYLNTMAHPDACTLLVHTSYFSYLPRFRLRPAGIPGIAVQGGGLMLSVRNELRSALLDALSHEIKTPLTAIKASVTTLLSGNGLSENGIDSNVLELLNIINDESDRLDRVVNESIEIAKIEFLEKDLKRSDLGKIVGSLISSYGIAASRCIRTHIPRGLPPVNIDFRLAKLAVKQLVDNALKYSVPGSPVLVSARELCGKIGLSVKDSGPGILDKEQARILEKHFRRKNESIFRNGMGLSIARRIVEAHGGNIELESQPGGGCVFRILFAICRRGA
jgi:two-component system, OmpR family, sensor histidine kinase KdpD